MNVPPLIGLKPVESIPVYDIVREAEIDVKDWSLNKAREPIDPYTNTYRNNRWKFGGGNQPILLSLWWHELDLAAETHQNNMKAYAEEMVGKLTTPGRTAGEAQRLRGKIAKAGEVISAVFEAFKHRKSIQVMLLEGNAIGQDDAEFLSSSASKRRLDPVEWYVHSYEPITGAYSIHRGVKAPAPPAEADQDDPGEDPAFLLLLADPTLTSTEKDALVKLRVGQGKFRERLLQRWGNCCSVTNCTDTALLIASHIVPWSRCETKEERLSPANGLLLTPTLDKLFDKGLITFDGQGKIVFSALLTKNTELALKIDPGMRLRNIGIQDFKPYMDRHRAEIFQSPARN